MNKKLTVLSVIIAHLGAITGLVFIAGCQSRTGYEGQHNLSAFNGRTSSGGFGGPGAVGVTGPAGGSSVKVKAAAPSPAPEEIAVQPPSAAEAPSTAYVAPAPVPESAVAPAPAPLAATTKSSEESVAPVGAGRTYIVKKNDSFWIIARREGVTTDELAAANGLSKNAVLKEGQKLVIPASSGRKVAVQEAKSAVAVSAETYTVKSGDSISVIARRLGTTQAALRSANGLKNDNIRVGQTLKVPADARNKTASAAPAPKAAPTAAKPAAAKPADSAPKVAAKPAPAPAPAPAAFSGLRPVPKFGEPSEAPAPAPAPVAPGEVAPMPDAVDATPVAN